MCYGCLMCVYACERHNYFHFFFFFFFLFCLWFWIDGGVNGKQIKCMYISIFVNSSSVPGNKLFITPEEMVLLI